LALTYEAIVVSYRLLTQEALLLLQITSRRSVVYTDIRRSTSAQRCRHLLMQRT
jgi:hypothetical protein